MPVESVDLQDRFRGCLLGLAIGDTLGTKFEAQSAEAIRVRFAGGDLVYRRHVTGNQGRGWTDARGTRHGT